MTNFSDFTGIKISLVAALIYSGLLYVTKRQLSDLRGTFSFAIDGVEILAFRKKIFVSYSEILSVTRESYTQQLNMIVASATQANLNQYRITLKDGKGHIFRVAHSEENAYHKAVDKLIRKIYGINRLGVHLTSRLKHLEMTTKQRDKEFRKQQPERNYTLVKAMNLLLSKAKLELIDLTEPQEI